MQLSDIRLVANDCEIMHECEFDRVGLVGKNYPTESRIISFLENEKYIEAFLNSKMAGVICSSQMAEAILDTYYGVKKESVVDASAIIHKTAVITKNVPDKMQFSGDFAIEHSKFIENLKESVREKKYEKNNIFPLAKVA